MGDMGDVFRAMTEAKKERKQNRLETANDAGWEKHTPYHWYRLIKGEKLNYWPSTGACMYKGKRKHIKSKFIQKLIGDSND